MNPNIDIYLRSAFKELDAFAIPRIGTFRKVHRAAHIAAEVGELRPPVLEIEFESEVKDSLLLTSYLTNNIHMRQGEAEQIVSDISNTISHALKSRRKFEIAEIGLLRRSSEGKLSFSTNHHNRTVFADDYFGLQPIQYISPATTVELESDPVILGTSDPSTHQSVTSSSTTALKIVAMVGLILMLGITVISTVRTERSTLVQRPPLPKENGVTPGVDDQLYADNTLAEDDKTNPVDDNTPNETPRSTISPQTENPSSSDNSNSNSPVSVAPANELIAAILEREVPPATTSRQADPRESSGLTRGSHNEGSFDALKPQGDPDPNYYLIVGSFSNERKAKEFSQKLKNSIESADPIILYSHSSAGNSRIYRVAIYKSSDRTQVNRVMKELKRSKLDLISDPWIHP